MKKLLWLFLAAGILFLSGCVVITPRTPWDITLPLIPVSFAATAGLITALALYFLPTIIVLARRKKNVLGPILVNVLLGWTFVGWIVALIWALTLND